MSAPFVRRSVERFMPGEHLDAAIAAARDLRPLGLGTMLTKLGENVTTPAEADAVTDHYLHALDLVASEGLDAQLSVKPTQLGLDLDAALCERNLRRLLDRAAERQNFVWIDMESSRYVDPTLSLFRRARARTDRVGVAIQAYLRRTPADVEAVLPLGPSIRLVKGAYLEPATIAFPKKSDVDAAYRAIAARILGPGAVAAGSRLQIATHDPKLVQWVTGFIAEHQVPSTTYEHAMLYGIGPTLQRELLTSGRRLRVLVSYGEEWFPWYVRRLAERPANLWFVAKNLLVG